MEVEDDHDKTPSWLTKEYLENLLRLHFKDDKLRIKELSIAPATGKGEHYGSVMVRAKISSFGSKNNESQSLSLIIKTTYEDEFSSKTLTEYNVFDCEITQFSKFLPTFHKMLSAVGDTTKLAPEAFHIDFQTKSLFLEDLCVLGYRNANRVFGMDLVHAKMLMSKIARYHAASVILHSQDNAVFENFDKGMFNRKVTTFNTFFEANLDSTIDQISQWGTMYDKYVQKLLKLQKVFIEKATALYDLSENNFHVLNHGDLWTNNMMFIYKNEQPIDVLMVDFQTSLWNSPVLDLIYFFNTSLQEDIRETAQDELIQFYHENLEDTFRKLNYRGKIITLLELKQEFKKKQLLELIFAFLIRPLMIEDERHIDLTTMIKTESKESLEYRKYLYSKENIIKTVKSMLPRFYTQGVLDC